MISPESTVQRVDPNAGIEQLKQLASQPTVCTVMQASVYLCVLQLTEAWKERYNHNQRGLVDCWSAKYPN